MSPYAPQIVADRYRLVAPLGQGGMGRVWRAVDEVLHRDVAIKELVPPPGLTTEERQEMRERSLREARAIARLNNINVVRVFDVLQTDADPWIVMEYVPSRSLHDVLASDGPVTPVRAAEIGLGVLNALRAAHRAGVVHRDVKPGNVLLGDEGRVVLTDFGLATVPGDPNVTRTGLVLGSPAYIAPERARDGSAGPQADLWSLGATLYAAVEGQSPYARPSAIATLAALATEPPPAARNAGPLKPVLAGLLRKDPGERIGAAEAERLLNRATGRRTRPGLPMSPTLRRPGIGRGRDPLPPVVPGPRPPHSPVSPPAAPPNATPRVYAFGKASVPVPPPATAAGTPATPVADPPAEIAPPPEQTEPAAGATPAEPVEENQAVGEPGGPPATPGAQAAVPDAEAATPDAETATPDARAAATDARSETPAAPPGKPVSGGGPEAPPKPAPAAKSRKHKKKAARAAAARNAAARAAAAGGTAAGVAAGAGAVPAPAVASPVARPPADAGERPAASAAGKGVTARPGSVGAAVGEVPPATPTVAGAGAAGDGVPTWLRDRRTLLLAGVAAVLLLLLAVVVPLSLRDDGEQPPQGTGQPTGVVTPTGAVTPPASAAPTDSPAPTPGSPSAPAGGPGAGQSAPPAEPSPTAANGAGSGGEVPDLPAGWRTYTSPEWGYSVPVPQGWSASRDGPRMYFREQGGYGRILIIDQSRTPKPDPEADWRQQEAARRGNYRNYELIRIETVDYWNAAADWEWRYTSNSGNRIHVLNRGFITAPDQAYSIYWSAPDARWDTERKLFDMIAARFRPARTG